MRFPKIDEVAAELRAINKQQLNRDDEDEGIDVRLQVYPDGDWAVRWGLSDYDQDHRGFWGSSSVPGNNRRFDSKDIARDLISQAKEAYAMGGDEELDERPRMRSPAPAARVASSRARAPQRVLAHREPVDEHAATELVMYIENTSDLSPDGPRGQGRDVLLNALRKFRAGVYDPQKAVKLFEYLVESGAKRYAKEFDRESNWSRMFNPATRQEAARQLEESFRSSATHGEYDHVDTRGDGSRPVLHTPHLRAPARLQTPSARFQRPFRSGRDYTQGTRRRTR